MKSARAAMNKERNNALVPLPIFSGSQGAELALRQLSPSQSLFTICPWVRKARPAGALRRCKSQMGREARLRFAFCSPAHFRPSRPNHEQIPKTPEGAQPLRSASIFARPGRPDTLRGPVRSACFHCLASRHDAFAALSCHCLPAAGCRQRPCRCLARHGHVGDRWRHALGAPRYGRTRPEVASARRGRARKLPKRRRASTANRIMSRKMKNLRRMQREELYREEALATAE